MTFLEFLAGKLMGPPTSQSNGRSNWHCPFHDDNNPSFCTLPPKEGCKDRFRCWSCGAWGDVYDLLKEFYPNEDFGLRKDRRAKLLKEFEQNHSSSFSFSGEGVAQQKAMVVRQYLLYHASECWIEDCSDACRTLRGLPHWTEADRERFRKSPEAKLELQRLLGQCD